MLLRRDWGRRGRQGHRSVAAAPAVVAELGLCIGDQDQFRIALRAATCMWINLGELFSLQQSSFTFKDRQQGDNSANRRDNR
jgi:hypothetical protein